MPNWVDSRVSIYSKTKESLDKFISDGGEPQDGMYSFESWVPMPKIFRTYDTTNTRSGNLTVGEEIYLGLEREKVLVTEEFKNQWIEIEQKQLADYGVIGWYDWSVKYWGTKWNADFEIYRGSQNSAVIELETAWNGPISFFAEISKRYPDFVIDILSHDEGGWNSHVILKRGKASRDISDYDALQVKDTLLEQIEKNEDLSEKERKELISFAKEYTGCDCYYILDSDPECIWNNFQSFVDYKRGENGRS